MDKYIIIERIKQRIGFLKVEKDLFCIYKVFPQVCTPASHTLTLSPYCVHEFFYGCVADELRQQWTITFQK
jgi:hypothetical protein